MAGGAGGPDGFGVKVLHQSNFFYVYNGLVVSTDPKWLQGVFNSPIGLFDKVGLRTNFGNIVGMICRICRMVGTQSEAAY